MSWIRFVPGNAADYLIYEEVRMVLSGMYHREKVADIKAREAKLNAEQAEFKAQQAEAKAEEAEAAARAARATARAARAVAIVAAQPPGEAQAAAAARAAERAAVAAWYERQQAAQRAGLPFAEPPPGYDNGGKGSGPAV